MKRIFYYIFLSLLSVFCIAFTNTDVFADGTVSEPVPPYQEDIVNESKEDFEILDDLTYEEPKPLVEQYYVDWRFYIYNEPDFYSEKVESFPPQYAFVMEWRDDGWARILTYRGEYWAYLKENKLYVDKYLPLYDNKNDVISVGSIGAQVVKIIEREENWILIETWLGEKWTDLNAIRTFVLLDVPSYNQRFLRYPTGCEIVSTAMMINYTTEVDVDTLVFEMPRSQNPNEGFRGNPATSGGFTIYPPALLSLTERYLGSAKDMSGNEIEDLKRKLNDNIPIIAWVNGLGFNVHAICLTGYNEEGFYYNDPWTGKKDSFITYDSFYRIWDKPIYDRLHGSSHPTRKALSYGN